MAQLPELHFSRNIDHQRVEAYAGDTLAGYVEYSQLVRGLLFSHTEVFPEFEGRGVGSRLAQRALDEARTEAQTVVPACQFIAGYIRRHPEYLDLVSPDVRTAFQL